MKNNAINSLILFFVLSVATIFFLGQYQLRKLLVLIPICFFVSLVNFAYEERKQDKKGLNSKNKF